MSHPATPSGYLARMATITRVLLIDDTDGTEAAETVKFNLDKQDWEIDLSEQNAARLRDKLARFVEAANPVSSPKAAPAKRGAKSASVASNRERVADIRRWAAEAGIAVNSRGRIAKSVQEAYEAR